MTLAEALAFPNSRKVYLLHLTAGWVPTLWVNDATYTNTWTVTQAARVEGVAENGTALNEATDAADCNTGTSYYHDTAAGTLYVNTTAADPNAVTVTVTLGFRYSNFPKVFSSVPWLARLMEAPRVSKRIPERFSGLGQVGGGWVTLRNGDQGLDALADHDLDAGTANLKLGADVPR